MVNQSVQSLQLPFLVKVEDSCERGNDEEWVHQMAAMSICKEKDLQQHSDVHIIKHCCCFCESPVSY